MKVGICVTTHRSQKLRPDGVYYLSGFLNSFKYSNFQYDYKIYVTDNASEIPFEYPEDLNIDVHKVEDQTKEGLTGAWNNALHRAYLDGCDIIWNFNDDITLNETMNNFIEVIQDWDEKDITIFGPASDNGGYGAPNKQANVEEGVKRLDIRENSWVNLPNGFSFAFTNKFYEDFRYKENKFFPIDHKLNGGDGKWGGQEGYFSILVKEGIKAVIVKSCWLKHYKTKTWERARDNG